MRVIVKQPATSPLAAAVLEVSVELHHEEAMAYNIELRSRDTESTRQIIDISVDDCLFGKQIWMLVVEVTTVHSSALKTYSSEKEKDTAWP